VGDDGDVAQRERHEEWIAAGAGPRARGEGAGV
jgi:hypothetical protein